MNMNVKVLITLISLFIYLANCENTNRDYYENEAEDELPDAVKKYVSRIISDMAERYDLRFKRLEKTILDLQQTTIAHKRQIKELKTDNRVKTNVISKLEKRIENLGTKADALRSDNETKDIEDSEKDISKHQLTDWHRSKSTMPKKGRVNRGFQSHVRRTNVETRVAFFASMSSNSPHLGRNQDMVFDRAITNIGNAYNERHGTFIAPVAGTYAFSVTLAHYKSGSLSHNVDGNVVVNGIAVARLNMSEEQSSQMIIVNLKAGDDVTVENRDTDEGVYGSAYSTFSGFLLYEDENVGSIVG